MPASTTTATRTTTSSLLEGMDTSLARRLPWWIALAIFSAICLAASESNRDFDGDGEKDDRSGGEKWVLSVLVISMCLSFFAVLAYLFVRKFVAGERIEQGLVLLLSGFWSAGLAVIMNPDMRIAVTLDVVVNANLYFFSWACLACCLFLAASLLQEKYGVNKASPVRAQQFCLASASLIAMVSAVRVFRDNGCRYTPNAGRPSCRRTVFAIALGVITFLGTVGLIFASTTRGASLPILVDVVSTGLLFVSWCFGVGYITFGTNSPGAKIGNLFFASWICFVLTLSLFSSSLTDFIREGDNFVAAAGTANNNNGINNNATESSSSAPPSAAGSTQPKHRQ